jgi:hypothetical protein
MLSLTIFHMTVLFANCRCVRTMDFPRQRSGDDANFELKNSTIPKVIVQNVTWRETWGHKGDLAIYATFRQNLTLKKIRISLLKQNVPYSNFNCLSFLVQKLACYLLRKYIIIEKFDSHLSNVRQLIKLYLTWTARDDGNFRLSSLCNLSANPRKNKWASIIILVLIVRRNCLTIIRRREYRWIKIETKSRY